MRFQTSKTISVEDPEIVLRALETCLRDAPINAVRLGREITLHGLGPSPRTINQHDTAVLRVELEEDRTIINADVSFQASCFLTDTQQDDAVNSKLDQIFDQMELEIASEQLRSSSSSQPPDNPSSAVALTENHPPSQSSAESHEAVSAPYSNSSALFRGSPPASQIPALAAILDQYRELESVENANCIEAPNSIEITQPDQTPKTQTDWLQSLTADIIEPPAPSRIEPSVLQRIAPLVRKSIPWPILNAILGILLLIGGSYLLHFNKKASTPPSRSSSPVTQLPLPPATAATNPALSVADPRIWLQSWVAAMRTRDFASQASFYADPVSDYLGKKNVSHTELSADKKTAIQNRAALWTVKLEKVSLIRQSATAITVHLIQHSMAQAAPGQMSEKFTPTRLQLRRMAGQWKIVSETN